jgi:hypothetical protein
VPATNGNAFAASAFKSFNFAATEYIPEDYRPATPEETHDDSPFSLHHITRTSSQMETFEVDIRQHGS